MSEKIYDYDPNGDIDEPDWPTVPVPLGAEPDEPDEPDWSKMPPPAGSQTTLKRKWDDPTACAIEFLQSHTWVLWRQHLYGYGNGVYMMLNADDIDRPIKAYLDAKAERISEWLSTQPDDGKPKMVPTVNTYLIREVRNAVRLKCPDVSSSELNMFIRVSTATTHPHNNFVSVQNGLIDLTTRTLLPHTSAWFSTTQLPMPFDKDATCPKWNRLLGDVLGGPAEIGLLQRYFGYTLWPTSESQKLLFLVGSGSNGKSVVLCVLRTVLGEDSYSSVRLEDLDGLESGPLIGKLANIVEEQGFLKHTIENSLKAITGGGTRQFKIKGEKSIKAHCHAKHIFASNNPPPIHDRTDGMARRLIILPFTNKFEGAKRNSDMINESYWRSEGSGILNWMLDGLGDWAMDKPFDNLPERCKDSLHTHLLESNPEQLFLLEYEFTGNDGDYIGVGELYKRYQQYMDVNGYKDAKTPIKTTPKFGAEVEKAFPQMKRGKPPRRGGEQVRSFIGIRPRADAIAAPPGAITKADSRPPFAPGATNGKNGAGSPFGCAAAPTGRSGG